MNFKADYSLHQPKQWLMIFLIFLLNVTLLAVIGVRGGLQRIPIDIINAGSMSRPEEAPIVLNSPFTLIKSVDHRSVEEFHLPRQ